MCSFCDIFGRMWKKIAAAWSLCLALGWRVIANQPMELHTWNGYGETAIAAASVDDITHFTCFEYLPTANNLLQESTVGEQINTKLKIKIMS
jgi:hypothetical protein